MASKRSVSPGPIDLMKEILKLIAEPISSNSKKKQLEVPCLQQPGKVINHDYCDACSGGGEIVCCDRCPKSYHINCHVPTINKLPDGEWFCRSCAFIGNGEFNPGVPMNDNFDFGTRLRILFNFNNAVYVTEERYLEEVPIQHKYNVKLHSRKQLDKLKMIRKNDKCCICKRGVIRGRLVQCHYCCRLYHINCLDVPIRDWDHSMRWICPEHNKFYELAYPDMFAPNYGVLTDTTTIKRLRCDLPSLPVNKSFNIPSHINSMYKEPDENIPTTENSSLNILCDVASFALETINSNYKTNNENVSNDISVKFLASQCLDKLQRNKCLPSKQPTASLSCLSISVNISIQKKTLTIGKNPNNNLCLLPYGNCDYVSDYHATITFDDKLGDYLVKNHSRHGIVVDNVSYFGSHRPKDLLNNSEFKKINSEIIKHINKRRRSVRKHDMFHIYQNTESGKMILKYIGKRRKFDYRPLDKYYTSKFKNIKHAYRKIQCKCSKRLVPKDGFAGQALLRNESMISIGCMQFKFTYDTCIKEVLKVCTESKLANQDGEVIRNKPLNGICLKSKLEQENIIGIIKNTKNEIVLDSINQHNSLKDTNDTNLLNEQTHTRVFDLNNVEGHGSSNDNTNIDCVVDSVITSNDNDELTLKINPSESSNMPDTKHWNHLHGVSNKIQSCFASDLIQEFEVNESSEDGETIEEEIVYEMNDAEAENSTTENIGVVQDWIIEEIVLGEGKNCNSKGLGHSVNLKSASTTGNFITDNREDYKTEHLYCARSPSNNHQLIVISDDDDD